MSGRDCFRKTLKIWVLVRAMIAAMAAADLTIQSPFSAKRTFRNLNPINSAVIMSSDVRDVSARRTWDREEAERNYTERLAREKAEAKEAKSKKALGSGKLPPPASTDLTTVQARTEAIIKSEELHCKRELVAPLLSRSNKGKSAGFYCETCDLTFKDSISYLDHLNSSQHYRKLGISGRVERATLEQVQNRLAWLREIKIEREKEAGRGVDLVKRVAERKRLEEEERKRRREKKKAQRRRRRQQELGASDVEMSDD